MVLSSAVLFLTGVWASLQFRWLQMQSPGATLAGERVLLSGGLPVAATMITWGLVEAVGVSPAPYYLMVILMALYFFLSRPLPSSFYGQVRNGSLLGVAGCRHEASQLMQACQFATELVHIFGEAP